MDKLVVRGNRITEYIDKMTVYISDFISIIKNIDKEKQKLVWESDNSVKMMQLFDEMVKNYLSYTDRMIKLIEFLNKSINRYDETLDTLKKEYNTFHNKYNDEVMYG